MSAQDMAIVEAAVQFWNAGARDSFLALFHPEGRWSSAIKRQVEGGDGLYRGRDEIAGFWDEWHAVWDDLEIVVSEMNSPRTGRVFAFGALRARGTGSGADTERPFGWVFQIDGGQIQDVRAYLDRDEALRAAGLQE